ncbi:hypothetical protein NE237_002617 [Protea cynaroides]|uniref:polynucleotide adenylyltransferase n=1 Tax=Protea cynaroides TaxID=273540 RepID=A0A9Q0KWE9_9MAGN|nr:hypothetical protein NE237_002617 [Protea cynaroides]
MFKNWPEVSKIHCVKDAKVPLMQIKFNGISVDLPYAQLKVNYIPDNVDILNPFLLRNIDDTSWKSLSEVQANTRILQLVSYTENFQAILRCLKLLAKRQGVYGNLHGFLGGICLRVLAAYVINGILVQTYEVLEIKPNCVTLCSLVRACGRAGTVNKIGGILRFIENSDVMLDTVFFNCLIDAYGRMGSLAEMKEILVMMEKRVCKPHKITYNTMIKVYLNSGITSPAKELLDVMNKEETGSHLEELGSRKKYTLASTSMLGC